MVAKKKCLDRPNLFQKGNTIHPSKPKRQPFKAKKRFVAEKEPPTPTKYMRLSPGLYDQSSKAERGIPCLYDKDGNRMAVKILRPRSQSQPAPPKRDENLPDRRIELESNRIFNYGKVEELWNTAISGHRSYSPRCRGHLEWDVKAEQQWGLGWIEKLHCQRCSYKSPAMKLFQEVDTGPKRRGRKPGASNRALQVGLSHCMIGNAAMRDLLLALNIPAPASSSMQHQSNTLTPVLEQVNQEDMAVRLKNLMSASPSIMVEGDCRYNNSLQSAAGKTPYQPATQAVYAVSENVTDQKQVLSVVCKNKHCRVAERLRQTGRDVVCPNHEGHCSANLQPEDPIGNEGSWAGEAFQQMFEACPNVSVKYFTTDGDSRAFAGLQQVQGEYSNVAPEHLRDTRHLTENMRYAIKKAKFTAKMFPGPNQTSREKQQGFFALELSRRCQSEFETCHKNFEGDLKKIQQAMVNLPGTLIQCYQGDCSDCNTYSFVCGSRKQNKWTKSYINFQIDPSPADEKLLLKLIAIRLGEDGLSKTRFNTSTQKSEAFNRTLSRCNPKNVTFKRNFKGRVHSAAHLLNSGIALSTMKKCEAVGAHLQTSSRVGSQLWQEARREKYIRKKMQSTKFKTTRRERRKKRFDAYFVKMEEVHYKKGLLLESQGWADHSYALRQRTSDGEYPTTSGIQTRSRGRKVGKWTLKN